MTSTILDLLTDLEKKPNAKKYSAKDYDLSGFSAWLKQAVSWGDSLSVKRPAIHVAGTKGKGSVSAMCEALLQASGYSTGLFTSPHSLHFGERFRINGRALSLQEFETRTEKLLRPQLNQRDDSQSLPTVFEVLTALSFLLFDEKKVQAEIYEVGLGGRLDSTNVIQPEVTLITPIGLDHTAILGDTAEKIAVEKAGIIKPNTPVILFDAFDDLREKARNVILQIAEKNNAPIIKLPEILSRHSTESGQAIVLNWNNEEVQCQLSMHGTFQARNWCMAIAAVDTFLQQKNHSLSVDAIQRAASAIEWAGRLQIIQGTPTLVIDSAHCPLSAKALGESLQDLHPVAPAPYALLWGMQKDKDHSAFLSALTIAAPQGAFSKIVCYQVPGERGTAVNELLAVARQLGIEALGADSLEDTLKSALQIASKSGTSGSVLACGTVYTTAQIADHYARQMN